MSYYLSLMHALIHAYKIVIINSIAVMWIYVVVSYFRVSIKESSVAKLGSVCRRVYRIFSHAYFHHRTIFDEFEVFRLNILVNIWYKLWIQKHGPACFDSLHYALIICCYHVFQNETSLCRRFTYFVTKYNLMSKDNLIVPIIQSDGTVSGESEA